MWGRRRLAGPPLGAASHSHPPPGVMPRELQALDLLPTHHPPTGWLPWVNNGQNHDGNGGSLLAQAVEHETADLTHGPEFKPHSGCRGNLKNTKMKTILMQILTSMNTWGGL